MLDHLVELLPDRLGGLLDIVDKAKEPLDQLDSKARSTSLWLYEISMSFKWQSTHYLDRSVKGAIKLPGSWTEDVPDW